MRLIERATIKLKTQLYLFFLLMVVALLPVIIFQNVGAEVVAEKKELSEQSRAVDLAKKVTRHNLAPHLFFYEDPTGKKGIAEIQKPEIKWQANQKSYRSFGFTSSSIWGYFDLRNQSAEKIERELLFDFPLLDDIRVFHISSPDSSRIIEYQSGNRWREGEKPLHYRLHLVPIEIHPDSQSRIYFRVKSSDSIELPLYLLNGQGLLQKMFHDNLLLGLYFGVVTIMSLYNLLIFIALRDRSHLYYVGFALAIATLQLGNQGFIAQYIFPTELTLQKIVQTLALNSSMIFALLLVSSFSDSKTEHPLYSRVMKGLLYTIPAFTIVTVADYDNISLSMVLALAVTVFSIYGSYLNYRRYNYNRYFFWGLTVAMLGMASYLLKSFNLVWPLMSRYGLVYAHSIELLLISFALALKMRSLDQEKSRWKREEEARRLTLKKVELKQKSVELASIKKLIQPHYLLNSLSFVVRKFKSDPRLAREMINTMSDEFYFFNDYVTREKVSLSDELQICRSHLKVMGLIKKRNYTLTTGELDGAYELPPLIFHTLIENAITHESEDSSGFEFRITLDRTTPPEKKLTIRLEAVGSFQKNENPAPGTGTRYIESRLEEAFPGNWRLTSGATASGWLTCIALGESVNDNS